MMSCNILDYNNVIASDVYFDYMVHCYKRPHVLAFRAPTDNAHPEMEKYHQIFGVYFGALEYPTLVDLHMRR